MEFNKHTHITRIGLGRAEGGQKRLVQRLGGRGCNKFVPVLGGDGTKIAPTGDIFDQPLDGIS